MLKVSPTSEPDTHKIASFAPRDCNFTPVQPKRTLHRVVKAKNVLDTARLILASPKQYRAYLALDKKVVRAAQALRFRVFNLELHEGLVQSFQTGLDQDPFDVVCDHLVVEHRATQTIVGTYRLQTGQQAAANLGYYCAQEFEFGVFEPIRTQVIELGRACVDADHRNRAVLGLLWKGIADYAHARQARFLLGCSSLTSQDPAVAASAYEILARDHLAPEQFRTRPMPEFACPLDSRASEPPKIPKLLRAYLGLGAAICGPPALDREFSTIDFLTLLDLQTLDPLVRQRYLG